MNKNFCLAAFIFLSCNNINNHQNEDKGMHADTSIAAISDTSKLLNPVGKWKRQSAFDGATLNIQKSNGKIFNFSLSAASGSHTGELEGIATIENNTATFLDTTEFTGCKILFHLFKDSIVISQSDGNCGAGMGVTYDGTYRAATSLTENQSITTVTVLEDAAANDLLKKITGKYYELFQESSQMKNTEEESLDGAGIKVQSAGIRGLFTLMENIVMTDESGHIWAAVIDDQKVRYFTNVSDDKNRLPKTIEKWRERFKEYKIIYEK